MRIPAVVAAVLLCGVSVVAQTRSGGSSWTPPRTPWGHPDISGTYTNKDEANTPLERPTELAGRKADEFTAADLERLSQERDAWPRRSPGASAARKRAPVRRTGTSTTRIERPRVVPDRSRRWTDSGDDATGAEARGGRRGAQRCSQRRGPRRLVAGSKPLRPMHHAWIARFDDAGHLRELLPDPADTRRRRHPLRDDPRDPRHPARRTSAHRPAIRQFLGDARAHWEGTRS
jgi:hypothetical protein